MPMGIQGFSAAIPSMQYAAPATGATVTVNPGTNFLVLEPAGTIATLTVNLPAGADGQVLAISSTQIITAVTLAASGAETIAGTITTLAAANSFCRYIFRSTKWYRCG